MKFHVILTSLVDAFRDKDLNEPETKDYHFDIEAEDDKKAVAAAKELHHLSVWESDVYLDTPDTEMIPQIEINWYWGAKPQGRKVQVLDLMKNENVPNVLAILDVLDLERITTLGGDHKDSYDLLSYCNDYKGTTINPNTKCITTNDDTKTK